MMVPEEDTQKKKILQQFFRDQIAAHEGGELDLSNNTKLWYATPQQSDLFEKVATIDFSGAEEVLTKHLEQIRQDGLAVVDYGCGNGEKGIKVHKLVGATEKLILIDYSSGMLSTAAKNAEKEGIEHRLMDDVNLGNSQDVFRHEKGTNPRLHLFLGQTIGNPQHPEDFIECIATSMRKDEYLLVEWFKAKKEHYDTNSGKNFRLSYIGALGIPQEHVTDDAGRVDHFIDETEKGWFKSCFRVHKDLIHPETGKKLSVGDIIVATRSRRFEDEEVVGLFEKHNLEGILTDGKMVYAPTGDPEKRYALFRKKRSKNWGRKEILDQYGIDIDALSLDEVVEKVVAVTTQYYMNVFPTEQLQSLKRGLLYEIRAIAEKTKDKKTVAKMLEILIDKHIEQSTIAYLLPKPGQLNVGEFLTLAMQGGLL